MHIKGRLPTIKSGRTENISGILFRLFVISIALAVLQLPTHYLSPTLHWTGVQLRLISTGNLNIDWTGHREIWSTLTSPWQLKSAKSSPRYFQTLARWRIRKFRNGWTICRNKMVRRRKLSVVNGLRGKTRGELRFTQYTIAGNSETGGDWCYRKPYVHITKRLSGANTGTYQEWVACMMCDHRIWEDLPTSKAKYELSWIKRLAIDEALRTKGFRVIVYFRVPSHLPKWYLKKLSQLRIGGKRKVQTICLPLRENLWEYGIQDIRHFESMYGEPLWK